MFGLMKEKSWQQRTFLNEAAVAKAKKILNRKDSGDDDDNGDGIIIEKLDGSSEKIPPEKAKLDKE